MLLVVVFENASARVEAREDWPEKNGVCLWREK